MMLRSSCAPLVRRWLRTASSHGMHARVTRANAGAAAAAAAAAAAVATATATTAVQTPSAARCDGSPIMTANRVLGDGRHRVALTAWPINDDPCGHFSSPEQLFAHAKRAGYDGLELTVDDFRHSFFPGQSYDAIISKVKALSRSTGVQIVGSLYHVGDGGWRREHEDGAPGRWDLDFNEPDFYDELARRIALDKALGSEYVTFQISLPPQYLNTGGEYRDDPGFIKLSAERIMRMQQICFEQGVNFYVETHIDRISEDVVGFAKIMDACPTYFEVNADISHYVYRGIKRGRALAKILARVGHTHQRMAREHGDLSADVEDPEKDWTEKGVTYQAFEAMKPAFSGGLSSRCVVGESGPMHLVKDAIALDAKLVPLYRMMAAECDKSAGVSPASRAAPLPASIADAEEILAKHFSKSPARDAAPSPQSTGGQMSEDEAEAILAQHFK